MAARPFIKILLRGLFPFSGTREPHYFDFILPLIVLLMYGEPIIVHYTFGDSSDVRAFAVIGGQNQTVQVGDVVARGKLVDDGPNQYYDIPPVSYGLSGSSDGIATISLQLTDDCQHVVAEISEDSASVPAGALCGLDAMGAENVAPGENTCPGEISGVTTGP